MDSEESSDKEIIMDIEVPKTDETQVETVSEACSRILLGLESLKPISGTKQDPKFLKRLSEERIRLLSTTTPDVEACMNQIQELLHEASALLTLQCLDSTIGLDMGNDNEDTMQLKSKVFALMNQLSEETATEVMQHQKRQLGTQLGEWRSKLKENDNIDLYWEGGWYFCKILKKRSEAPCFRVHFDGYGKKYERWVDVDEQAVPAHTYTVKSKPKAKKRKLESVENAVLEEEKEVSKPSGEVTTNRYGRVVVKSSTSTPNKRKGRSKKSQGSDSNKEGNQCGDDMENDEEEEGVGAGSKSQLSEDHNDWYCSVCMAFERDDAKEEDELLSCDGPCLRSFHLNCLGIDAVPDADTWLCDACQEKEHTCFLCHDSGRDAPATTTSSEENSQLPTSCELLEEQEQMGADCVVKCMQSRCGKFYHPQCIIDSQLKSLFVESSSRSKSSSTSPYHCFSCAHHSCATCLETRKGSKQHLYKCHVCPRSFHLNCIPPDSHFHEYCLICPTCSAEGHVLPPLHIDSHSSSSKNLSKNRSFKASSDKPEPEKILLGAKRMNYATAQSIVLADVKNKYDPRHFRLDSSILKEVESRPPIFSTISMNQYGSVPITKSENSGSCSCHKKPPQIKHLTDNAVGTRALAAAEKASIPPLVCGEDCENRLLRIECIGCENNDKVSEKTKNKMKNCCIGDNCGNRQISQKKGNVKVTPFMQDGMGWGLKLDEPVVAGQLIREYVGEVLTDAMLEERMAYQAKYNPNNVNMYVMELESGLFLDARSKGNVSRFINHCCDPNCELQKWIVNGITRIGIFAIKDMDAETALSYDYQFSTNEHSRFRCKCGAAKCRGSLSSQGFQDGTNNKNKKSKRLLKAEYKEILKKAKQSEKRELKLALEEHYQKIRRLDLTSRTLPGDGATDIKSGPPQRFHQSARSHRIFLVRNALKGNEMYDRMQLLDARDAKKQK